MRKKFIPILILSLSAAACSTPAMDGGDEIVTVHAEVVEDRSMAIHFDFDDGAAQWQDAVLLTIVYPPDWKGKDLRILFAQEPDKSPWRKVGTVYELSFAAKYLEDLNPEENVKHVLLGDIKGEIKLIKEAQNK